MGEAAQLGPAEIAAAELMCGLDEREARRRLAQVGPNELPSRTRPSYGLIAVRQLADPLVALLLTAAVVSLLVGEGLEALVIAGKPQREAGARDGLVDARRPCPCVGDQRSSTSPGTTCPTSSTDANGASAA